MGRTLEEWVEGRREMGRRYRKNVKNNGVKWKVGIKEKKWD